MYAEQYLFIRLRLTCTYYKHLFFYYNCTADDEDCPECDEILEKLEMIDGEADLFGKCATDSFQ